MAGKVKKGFSIPNDTKYLSIVRETVREVIHLAGFPEGDLHMLTVAVDEEHVLAAMSVGADGFLPKPFTMTECWAAIHEAVEQGLTLTAKGARLVAGELRRTGACGKVLGLLTPQERRTLDLVADGLADKEIGARLGISSSTVHTHVHHVLRKLGVDSRTAAARALHIQPTWVGVNLRAG